MLPLAAIERITRRAGIKRISMEAIKEVEKTVSELGNEVAMESANMAKHAGRRTIKKEDILLASGKA